VDQQRRQRQTRYVTESIEKILVADLPADAQSPEPVQQRKGLLDDSAVLAQARAVSGAAPSDDRPDRDRLDLLRYLSWS
jgi:hypothetical protein